MAQGTPNVAVCIPAGLRLLEHRPVKGGGSGREEACPRVSGRQANMSRLWSVADFDQAPQPELVNVVGLTSNLGGDRSDSAPVAFISGPTGVVGVEASGSLRRAGDLSENDMGNLNAVLDHEIARNTMKNYRVQWSNFITWAVGRGNRALPADPEQVAAYLAERIEEHGHKPATLRAAAAAIAFVHRTAGQDDPCASPEVKRTLRSATRKAGRSQKQADALTAEVLTAIRSTACKPRRGRGGRIESQETARCRGNLDIALVSLMRDGMLRVSEAAALTWKDIVTESDGTGRLLIRRSKTDSEGEGAVAFLSAPTMVALRSTCSLKAATDSVFGLRPNQISRRIKQAAQAAGLGDGFSGHSPRVGMARDLARVGIELPSLMNAGRWRTPAMPAHYTRNETAGKGAVAQFHGYCRRVA